MSFDQETQRLRSLLETVSARLEAWPRHSAGPMNGAWAALSEQQAYLRGSISNRERQRA